MTIPGVRGVKDDSGRFWQKWSGMHLNRLKSWTLLAALFRRIPPPAGDILDKSDRKYDSKPACSGVTRKSAKAEKVVLSARARVTNATTSGIQLLPPESKTRLIKGHYSLALSSLSPKSSILFLRARARTREESSQLWATSTRNPGPGGKEWTKL